MNQTRIKDALSPERDALWSRLEKTTFLTPDEKRAAIGYAPLGPGGMKYRPDQARDRIGRWTRDRGGAAPANLSPLAGDVEAGSEDPGGEDGSFEDIPDLGETADGRETTIDIGTDTRPAEGMRTVGTWNGDSETTPRVILAAERGQGFNVDLLEEEARGGHPVSEHVGKNSEYLLRRLNEHVLSQDGKVDFGGLAIGSFPSLEAANKLVNSTLSDNRSTIDDIVSGGRPATVIEKWFASPTGYEVYLARRNSQPIERETFGIRLFIMRDPASPHGFRVQTAFPVR